MIQSGDGFDLPLEEACSLKSESALRVGNALGPDDFDGDLLADTGSSAR